MDLTPLDAERWQACTDRAGYVGQIIKTLKTPKGYQALADSGNQLLLVGEPKPDLGDAHDALDLHRSPKRASCPNC
jgi:hypothetical protein